MVFFLWILAEGIINLVLRFCFFYSNALKSRQQAPEFVIHNPCIIYEKNIYIDR